MQVDLVEWLVHIAAHSPDPIDKRRIRQILEQSDLGGDIVKFADGRSSVSLAVVGAARSEQNAYHRVIARVKDTLGSHWTVEGDPSAVASTSAVLASAHRLAVHPHQPLD